MYSRPDHKTMIEIIRTIFLNTPGQTVHCLLLQMPAHLRYIRWILGQNLLNCYRYDNYHNKRQICLLFLNKIFNHENKQ